MREYVARFEAVGVRGQVGFLYNQWAHLYLGNKHDTAIWMDWGEAERVARRAITLQKTTGKIRAMESIFCTYEYDLGCVLLGRSKFTEAVEVLRGAFARFKTLPAMEVQHLHVRAPHLNQNTNSVKIAGECCLSTWPRPVAKRAAC